jgi:hypothetical protein
MTDLPSHSTQRERELAAIRELTDYLGIDEDVRAQAARIWEIIAPKVDNIIEAFYVRLHGTQAGALLDAAVIGRLKLSQRQHWQELFGSRFDDAYLRSATRVGIRHRGIGLDPKWYVAGYTVIKMDLTQAIMRTPMSLTDKARLIQTLDKYVAVDMGLALSSYAAAIMD